MVASSLIVLGAVATILLLLISAFFSSSEIAIFSLGQAWVDERAAEGDARGKRLARLRSDPHRLLVTLLVGNNVMNIAIGSIMTVILVHVFAAGTAVLVATLASSVVVLMFGEIVPKSWGLSNAERWALLVALPLSIAERVLGPLVVPMDWVTGWINRAISGEPEIEKTYAAEP